MLKCNYNMTSNRFICCWFATHLRFYCERTFPASILITVWLDETAAPDRSCFRCIGSQCAPICFHCCWARRSTGKVGNGTGPVRQCAFLSVFCHTWWRVPSLQKFGFGFNCSGRDNFRCVSFSGIWLQCVKRAVVKFLFRQIGGLVSD